MTYESDRQNFHYRLFCSCGGRREYKKGVEKDCYKQANKSCRGSLEVKTSNLHSQVISSRFQFSFSLLHLFPVIFFQSLSSLLYFRSFSSSHFLSCSSSASFSSLFHLINFLLEKIKLVTSPPYDFLAVNFNFLFFKKIFKFVFGLCLLLFERLFHRFALFFELTGVSYWYR